MTHRFRADDILKFGSGEIARTYLKCAQSNRNFPLLKDKFEVYKIIVKKQPYKLPNTNRDLFPICDLSNCHKNFHKLGQR